MHCDFYLFFYKFFVFLFFVWNCQKRENTLTNQPRKSAQELAALLSDNRDFAFFVFERT